MGLAQTLSKRRHTGLCCNLEHPTAALPIKEHAFNSKIGGVLRKQDRHRLRARQEGGTFDIRNRNYEVLCKETIYKTFDGLRDKNISYFTVG